MSHPVIPRTILSSDAIFDMVQRVAGQPVDMDVPLMEAGIDSLGAVELHNQLQQAVGTDAQHVDL